MKQIEEMPEEIEFEQQLAHAMRQVYAPEGFADKLMARAGLEDAASASATPWTATPQVQRSGLQLVPGRNRPGVAKLRSWYALAALLLVSVLSFAGYQRVEQQRLQHERRVRAEQQFDLALEITHSALDQTRQQLTQAGVPLER